MNLADLPFNRTIGIITEGDTAILTPRTEHLNHVGTVHATVVFGVGETAAAQQLLSRFPELAESYGAVLRSSNVKYRQPASPEFAIRAIGKLSEPVAVSFLEKLTARGRATIDIEVAVTQGDVTVLTGTYTWFAARRSD